MPNLTYHKWRYVMNGKIKKLLENNREPVGAWGRFWVHGMNFGHVFMARWGMKQLP